jgi:hypothetical protein
MNEELLNRPCVRVSVRVEGKTVNHGSGTLVKGSNGFFVVSAYHCLFGDNDQFVNFGIEFFAIERQEAFNSPFETVAITKLVLSDKLNDWAILKVDFDDADNSFPEILTSESFKLDTPVQFTGFQALNKEEARRFKSRVLNGITRNEFKITLAEQDNFQGGADDAKGLSGSGAFVINDGRLYLLGILKNVKGDEASNNDIKCCSMTNMIDIIGLVSVDISTDTFGDDWGSDMFVKLDISDVRNLEDKIRAVNSTISDRRISRLCRDLALGKAELSNLLDRDLSAIKYRIFEACQQELVDFVDQDNSGQLSNDQINLILDRFTQKAVDIIDVKSKSHKYPILDADLMRKVVLDLINDCYLSFDEEGIYE